MSSTSPIRNRRALSRDGHPVEILRIWTEEDVEFAEIRYLDGHVPGPVGGRVGGTEEEPTWEHRVHDGRVLVSGGNYYNDGDWTDEEGLRPMPAPTPTVVSLAQAEADADRQNLRIEALLRDREYPAEVVALAVILDRAREAESMAAMYEIEQMRTDAAGLRETVNFLAAQRDARETA